ncbi:MAG: hypothetical protein KAX40_09045 [Herpetosiphon sp.]|nr:hypothetical protein [Herpetosiphon sp.]
MNRSETESALRNVLACPTFNSMAGRTIEQRGYEALRALPKGFDHDLVRSCYVRYATEAPYRLWRIIHKTKREYAPLLLDALQPTNSLQADFIKDAVQLNGDDLNDEQYAVLIRAGTALNKINYFSSALATPAHAERVRFISNDPPLVAAIQTTLDAYYQRLELTNLLEGLWFIVILTQEGSPQSLALLEIITHAALKPHDQSMYTALPPDFLYRAFSLYAPQQPKLAELMHLIQQH